VDIAVFAVDAVGNKAVKDACTDDKPHAGDEI
jgi:hypothetical protein